MADMKEFSLNDVCRELGWGGRVLLMVRHAERPHIDHEDPTFGEALPITPSGAEAAVRFGAAFRRFASETQFMASPLLRTRMTAEFIASGMGVPDAEIPTDALLGNSSFYFSDQRAVFELFRDGSFFEHIFRYFADGSLSGFSEIHAATDRLEEWCLAHFSARLGIFTTHDLYIGAYLHARGVKTDFTVDNWIGFLDAAALVLRRDGSLVRALVRSAVS